MGSERRISWVLVALAVAAMIGCSGETSSGAATCQPGQGAFGDRCCGAATDCKGGSFCRAGQCTQACDAGADCAGLAADGGATACSNGACVPPPLPTSGGGDHGW